MAKKVFGKAFMNIAGTSFNNRQEYLWAMRKALAAGKPAYLTLKRDVKNEADENAIMVMGHWTNSKEEKKHCCIGYIPREKAKWLAKAMDTGKTVRVYNFNIVGGGNATLGCKIKLVHEMYEANATAAEASVEA